MNEQRRFDKGLAKIIGVFLLGFVLGVALKGWGVI